MSTSLPQTSLSQVSDAAKSFASFGATGGVIGACSALLFSASVINSIVVGMMLGIDGALFFFVLADLHILTQDISDFPWIKTIASLAIATLATIYVTSTFPLSSMHISAISAALCCLSAYALVQISSTQ
ncbi:MAG: hypothetical protein KGR16_05970 [Verrucomicrobia bacterium]|nr:hypothetical protein [Verrucomicrobiota bacterium]MDE3048188.1 hypothetical protein [Verrucomicrobiota bacterium]